MSSLWGGSGYLETEQESESLPVRNGYQKASGNGLQIVCAVCVAFILWFWLLCSTVPTQERQHRQWLEARERLERGRKWGAH